MTSNSRRFLPPQAVAAAAVLAAFVVLTACNGGLRPTLVADPAATPQPPLELNLSPAPESVDPLPATAADFPIEASVDDALVAWALDRDVPYRDSCDFGTPEAGQLCDVATERDTVRLLGPNANEAWYVVTVLETNSLEFGTGYRVDQVTVAGR